MGIEPKTIQNQESTKIKIKRIDNLNFFYDIKFITDFIPKTTK